jgi:hypothetical protein
VVVLHVAWSAVLHNCPTAKAKGNTKFFKHSV